MCSTWHIWCISQTWRTWSIWYTWTDVTHDTYIWYAWHSHTKHDTCNYHMIYMSETLYHVINLCKLVDIQSDRYWCNNIHDACIWYTWYLWYKYVVIRAHGLWQLHLTPIANKVHSMAHDEHHTLLWLDKILEQNIWQELALQRDLLIHVIHDTLNHLISYI